MNETVQDLTLSADVAIVGAGPIGLELAAALQRIGVDYAGKYRDKKWRFYLKDSKFVSRK